MDDRLSENPRPVALVTGAAVRIGAEIVRSLHGAGYNILLHYNRSHDRALSLAMSLNTIRDNSVHCLTADLQDQPQTLKLAENALQHWGRMDLLVNNASSFYPTPLTAASLQQWQELMASNARAPFFLAQQLAPALRKNQGAIINLVDIHADSGLKDYSLYSMAKAALANMTRVMAKELAPDVRVNGISPGAILWPDADGEQVSDSRKTEILQGIPMHRLGEPQDIADAVVYLARDATYITGQIIKVDGGRSLLG